MVSGKRFLGLALLVFLLLGLSGCDMRGCKSEKADSRKQEEELSKTYVTKHHPAPSETESEKEPVDYRRLADLADLRDKLPPPGPCRPVIDPTPDGIRPMSGKCGTVFTLRGQCFGEEQGQGFSVQLMNGDVQMYADIRSWADTLIEFDTPCGTVQPGTYRVRVVTPTGTSNMRSFTLIDKRIEWSDGFKDEG